jgi:hypothetical protein
MAFIQQVNTATGEHIPQGTLAKYVLGERIPKKRQMLLIHEATEGEVSPNDFYLEEK